MLSHQTTRDFSYNDAKKSFVSEASTLTRGGRCSLFHQIYQDSCDEGLILISDKTGAEVKFVVDNTETREGDILCWKLVPLDEEVRKNPRLKGVTMTIFND